MNKAPILWMLVGGLLATGVAWHTITDVRGVTSSKRSTQSSMPFLKTGLQLYVQEYCTLPEVTEGPELFKILTGANARKLRFCSAKEVENAAGQFLDGWDRPYGFEKTPGNLIIRSSGEDGIFHTKDDLTIEAPGPVEINR